MPAKKTKRTPKTPVKKTLLIDPMELDAAYALHLYPLYQFANDRGEMRVLLLCMVQELERMLPLLSTMIWCGQMHSCSLHIQVVSDDAEAIRSAMLERMPLLEVYTNIKHPNPAYCYVDFDFVTDERMHIAVNRSNNVKRRANEAGAALGEAYAAGFTAFSAGRSTAILAQRYMMGQSGQDCGKLLALDCEKTELSTEEISELKKVRAVHFLPGKETKNGRRGKFAAWLYDRALRHHLLYEGSKHGKNNVARFDDPEKGLEGRRSSAAAALHMAYKLKDIGLSPNTRNKNALAGQYAKAVLSDAEAQQGVFRALVALEHRRWIMYQAVNGWTAAAIRDCRKYCFEYDNGLSMPIFKFKIDDGKRMKLHPALVPGAGNGLLQALKPEDWDAFASDEEIDAAGAARGYDALAVVSLKLHRLAGEKIKTNEPVRQRHLEQLGDLAAGRGMAAKAFISFREWFLSVGLSDHSAREEKDQLEMIRDVYTECGVDAERTASVLGHLENDLKVVNEFYSYCDYEAFDHAFVEHLAQIYCRPERLTLIKVASEGMLDNAAPALLLEPDRVVMYGMEEEAGTRIGSLLAEYAPSNDLRCVPPKQGQSFAQRVSSLCKYVEEELSDGSVCVIDVTGASEDSICAVWMLKSSGKFASLGVVRCDSVSQRVMNLGGFEMAEAYRRCVSLPVKDMLSLFGIRSADDDHSDKARRSLLFMKRDFDKLWNFSRLDKAKYRLFYEIMQNKKTRSFEIKEPDTLGSKAHTYPVKNAENRRALRTILRAMLEAGLIMNWMTAEQGDGMEITCSNEMHATIAKMMSRLKDSGDLGLSLRADESAICVVCPKASEGEPAVFSWKGRQDRDFIKIKEKPSLTQAQAFSLRALAKALYNDGLLLSPYQTNGGNLYLNGPKCVVECLRDAVEAVSAGRLRAEKLAYDAQNCCLYERGKQTEIEEDEPGSAQYAHLVPEGSRLFAAFPLFSAHEQILSAELAEKAQLEQVLEAVNRREKGQFNGSILRSMIDPEVVRIVLRGPKWLEQILCEVIEAVRCGEVSDLVYEEGVIYQRDTRTYKADARDFEIRSALQAAQEYGVIESLTIGEDGQAVFDLVNGKLIDVFANAGNRLEYYTWYQAYQRGFDDVQNGYKFLWGEHTKNELDVLISKGLQLMSVSCKATPIYKRSEGGKEKISSLERTEKCKYNMYEVRTLADQFSRETKAVLLYLTDDVLEEPLKQRAKSMRTSVLVLDSTVQGEPPLRGSKRRLGEELEALMNDGV